MQGEMNITLYKPDIFIGICRKLETRGDHKTTKRRSDGL